MHFISVSVYIENLFLLSLYGKWHTTQICRLFAYAISYISFNGVHIFSELIQKHRCSLLDESDDRKSLNHHVLENLVLCAEVGSGFITHLQFFITGIQMYFIKPNCI